MSLKAYNGMMTRKGFSYLHKNLKEKLPLFQEASRKHLAKAFAEVFIDYTDKNIHPATCYRFYNLTADDKREISGIDINDTTILSYTYQLAKILCKSEYENDFTSHLNLNIEPKGKKILIYPGIHVPEHKEILMTFLEDWYAQNQCDPPEDVPTKEWKERTKDWLGFDETKGLQSKIILFDPNHYWNNLLVHFRCEELINAVLAEIPTEDKRKNALWKNDFIASKMEGSEFSRYFKALDYYTSEEGQKEFEEYKINNPIELINIDFDYISNQPLPEFKN